MMSRLALAIAGALAATAVGCNPSLDAEEAFQLEVGEIATFIVDAAPRSSNLKVNAESNGSPISVFVYPQEFEEEVDRMITLGKPSDLVLARETEAESIGLVVPIEANQKTAVRVHNAGREVARVKLTMHY